MQTIYDSLEAKGRSWKNAFTNFPHNIALRHLWDSKNHFLKYTDFANDIQRGILPNYSFIGPRYFDVLGRHAKRAKPRIQSI